MNKVTGKPKLGGVIGAVLQVLCYKCCATNDEDENEDDEDDGKGPPDKNLTGTAYRNLQQISKTLQQLMRVAQQIFAVPTFFLCFLNSGRIYV